MFGPKQISSNVSPNSRAARLSGRTVIDQSALGLRALEFHYLSKTIHGYVLSGAFSILCSSGMRNWLGDCCEQSYRPRYRVVQTIDPESE
jgi:hypothetical protein